MLSYKSQEVEPVPISQNTKTRVSKINANEQGLAKVIGNSNITI